MADAVTTTVLRNDSKYYAIHLTNISDGTGETLVKKVDISTLIGPDGTAPTSVSLLSARWCIQGFSRVSLWWDDDTADAPLMVMAGNGYDDFEPWDGKKDPTSGGEKDVLLNTTGTVSGNTYDITLVFAKVD
jgi:hypothetical protein